MGEEGLLAVERWWRRCCAAFGVPSVGVRGCAVGEVDIVLSEVRLGGSVERGDGGKSGIVVGWIFPVVYADGEGWVAWFEVLGGGPTL